MDLPTPDPAEGTAAPRVILYGRAGCHLCDQARTMLERVREDTGEAFAEVDIDADARLREKYSELVPVVTVDGVQQGYWRIESARVRAALAQR
ncbi:glutaredoxin family protein [Georgenia yuyongxinii]|uniref:Glutaredoxin family protein n=1 Tax=Georgenia yuyongxinii TaxID=2589797 RepID=A0A552WNU4_9MICO|nr:glutaredoxin family protein [Georgenia yuyongxinii]TRW44441.1 glutaredoxin family protein [Georgenia yuyongxinii]TRW44760.1 glutaredoxin family protein [Georgenia yuyongxinii]